MFADLTDDGTATFFVYLTKTADLSQATEIEDRDERLTYACEQLTTTAEESQADLRAMLEERGVEHTPFWASNTVLVKGDEEVLAELTWGRGGGVGGARPHRRRPAGAPGTLVAHASILEGSGDKEAYPCPRSRSRTS